MCACINGSMNWECELQENYNTFIIILQKFFLSDSSTKTSTAVHLTQIQGMLTAAHVSADNYGLSHSILLLYGTY